MGKACELSHRKLDIARLIQSAALSFRKLRPGSPWVLTGWSGIVSAFTILSYYAVVGGWVLH
jgi:NSS family neurotransmitter:Na+ symporter